MKVLRGSTFEFDNAKISRTLVIQAPGRLNLIGEHTDYNGGKVLPFCIDRSVQIRINVIDNGSDLVRVIAENIGEALEVRKSELPVTVGELPDQRWTHYVLGALSLAFAREVKIAGEIRVSISADLPLGAGLSSSAALCTGLLAGFAKLFGYDWSRDEIALLAQRVEHEYAGTKCGLMDQLAILYGESETLLKVDFARTDKPYGFALEKVVAHPHFNDYEVLVFNSNVAHALATSEYNVRRAECDELVKRLNLKFGKAWSNITEVGEAKVLGAHFDVAAPFSDLKDQVKEVANIIGGEVSRAITLAQRALHVISENLRLAAAVDAIRSGDLLTLHILLNNAHDSLAQLYQVSCPEIEALRFDILELAENIKTSFLDQPLIIGPRMCGGGFGGSLISLVCKDFVHSFTERFNASDKYKKQYGFVPTCFVAQISNGLTVHEL